MRSIAPFIIPSNERLKLPPFLKKQKHEFVPGTEKISIITSTSFVLMKCITANQSIRENTGVPVDIGTLLYLLKEKPELHLLSFITKQRPVTNKNPLYIFCSGSRIDDKIPVIIVQTITEISITTLEKNNSNVVNGCQIRYLPKN